MKKSTERNSVFEFIRIIAMLFIITYHLLVMAYKDTPSESLYKTVWLPLHIGVILYVLISGYFGIKCSPKGLIKLIGTIAIYYLPITLLTDFKDEGLKSLLFISHSPYWFIRTYLCLYLFSPILNHYLKDISTRNRISLILSLSFISIYIGTTQGDISLFDGKNLVNFSLIYVIGNTIKTYREQILQIPIKHLVCSYITINLLTTSIYYTLHDSIVSKFVWLISFPYCSPILIINAVLFFVIIFRLNIQSSVINNIASSMFAAYLIHSQPYINNTIDNLLCSNIIGDNIFANFIKIVIFSIVIMVACTLIDKIIGGCLNYILEFIYSKFAKNKPLNEQSTSQNNNHRQ